MSTNADRILIELCQGTIFGTEEELSNGRKMCVFKGVPYARPPVGNLRFMAPLALDKTAVPLLDCTQERDKCSQIDFFTGEHVGAENCLFLNIYTPSVKGKTLFPVMFFIHGGAFSNGSGDSDFYSPEYLVKEGVVVVTINYRLHVLGLLCLPSAGVEGNAGLKDQLMALKWTSQNITKFNGDPDNITLFGESMGAVSVNLHLFSPNSRKYFHRAIMQSGSAINEWIFQEKPEEKARSLAKYCGGNCNTDVEVINFLQNVPVELLMKNRLKVIYGDEKRRRRAISFIVVIEPPGPNAIVTQKPIAVLLQRDSIGGIPIMHGINNWEGLQIVLNKEKTFDEFRTDPFKFIPRDLELSPESPVSVALTKQIINLYFKDKPMLYSPENILNLAVVFGDIFLVFKQYLYAELHSKFQHKSTQYFYKFAFDGVLNIFKNALDVPEAVGAAHADELGYLFNNKSVNIQIEEDSPEFEMRQNMCRLWTNFAKFGNPTPANDKCMSIKWAPVERTDPNSPQFNLKCLYFGTKLELIENPDEERVQFWKHIYKIYSGKLLKVKL